MVSQNPGGNPDDAPEAHAPVVVARIIKPHGIHGEVVLATYSDVEGRMEETPSFLLMDQDRVTGELEVESRRFFQGRHVMKFVGVPTRTEAETLRGKQLAIPEDQIGALPDDHFFIHDLVGMMVRTKDGKEVGRVSGLLRTGGVDVLEVGEKGEIMIPFAAEICVDVDPDAGQITIDPPEGLLQLNAH